MPATNRKASIPPPFGGRRCKAFRPSTITPKAGKALPAIVVGLIASVGRVKGQRVALPTAIVRPATADATETALHATLLARVKATLADD